MVERLMDCADRLGKVGKHLLGRRIRLGDLWCEHGADNIGAPVTLNHEAARPWRPSPPFSVRPSTLVRTYVRVYVFDGTVDRQRAREKRPKLVAAQTHGVAAAPPPAACPRGK